MKNILLIALFLAFMSCERPTEKVNVPETVLASFKKKYPNINAVQWEVQHDKYIANFKKENKEIEAEFIADGTFLKEDAD